MKRFLSIGLICLVFLSFSAQAQSNDEGPSPIERTSGDQTHPYGDIQWEQIDIDGMVVHYEQKFGEKVETIFKSAKGKVNWEEAQGEKLELALKILRETIARIRPNEDILVYLKYRSILFLLQKESPVEEIVFSEDVNAPNEEDLQPERTRRRKELAKESDLLCPMKIGVGEKREIEIPNIHGEDCKNITFLRFLAAKDFHNEMREIRKIFDQVHYDNISDPSFMIQTGVKHLRMHHQCLEKICDKVFWTCAQTPHLSNDQASREIGWCQEKANKIMELQQAKFDYIMTGNQSRKERILIEERFSTIREHFRNYIHERMTNFLVQLKHFEGHVDKLIKWPKRN